MRSFDIALKDLTQIVREKTSFMFLLAMPIVFTFFIALVYRPPKVDPDVDNRLVLAFADLEQGTVSTPVRLGERIASSFENSEVVRLEPMSEAEARQAVDQEKAAGALIIPDKFSERKLAGEMPDSRAQLVLIVDPGSTNGQTIYQVVRGAVSRWLSAVEIAKLDVEMTSGMRSLSAEEQENHFSRSYEIALEKWNTSGSEEFIRTEMATAEEKGDLLGGNPYNQSSPGMLVMFAIFGLVSAGQLLIQERKTRTLERMRSTSLKAADIIGGHFLAMFLMTTIQQLLLVTFGQFVLGVNYLAGPLGILAVVCAFSLCVASLGLLIGVVAREEQQVILTAMAAMFIFSALGGAWFTLEGAGKTFVTIGKLTPVAWAMTGFQNILIRGLDSGSAILPAVVLLLYAAGFFSLAIWRFKKI